MLVRSINIIIQSVKIFMNLTHKHQRDHLAPVNTNISHGNGNQIGLQHEKDGAVSSKEIVNLQQIIQNLTYQNESMNAMVKVKNQQIFNLKAQLKSQPQSAGSLQGKPQQIRQIYHVNNFRPPVGETAPINSVQLDKAIYQIRVLAKQRDDLLKRIEQLQINNKNPNHTEQRVHVPVPIPVPVVSTVVHDNQQQAKIIQQYQEHISAMASKLSTVHKLQTQNAKLNEEKMLILNDFQGMRNQLFNRVRYCEHLENQLGIMEQQINNRVVNVQAPPTAHPQFQNLLTKNSLLETQIAKLNKVIAQKQQKLTEIQINKSNYIQVTKQAFQSMQSNLASLQVKVNSATDAQKKEVQKSTNLQVQINRLNRQFAEKTKKLENDNEIIKKIEGQKSELTSSLAKAKLQMKNLQKKSSDQNEKLQKLTAQNQKNKKMLSANNDYAAQLQNYKKKYIQSSQLIKKFTDLISQLQQKYRKVLKQNEQALESAQQGKKKWQFYERVFKQHSENITKLNEKLNIRTNQLDESMKNCLMLQAKLREFTRKDDDLNDQIEKYIREHTLERNSYF